MGFGWDDAAIIAANAAASLTSGGSGSSGKGRAYIGSPLQRLLLIQSLADYMRGGGEFGFAPAMREGLGTLENLMADRGIDPRSGAGLAALRGVTSQALRDAALNRLQYGLSLMQAQPWTVYAQGLGGGTWNIDPYVGEIPYVPSLAGTTTDGRLGGLNKPVVLPGAPTKPTRRGWGSTSTGRGWGYG